MSSWSVILFLRLISNSKKEASGPRCPCKPYSWGSPWLFMRVQSTMIWVGLMQTCSGYHPGQGLLVHLRRWTAAPREPYKGSSLCQALLTSLTATWMKLQDPGGKWEPNSVYSPWEMSRSFLRPLFCSDEFELQFLWPAAYFFCCC